MMTKKELDTLFFVSFCMEQYKKHIETTGGSVADLFDRYGVVDYLYENYEVLHTQGSQWLMVEIDEFIKERRMCE